MDRLRRAVLRLLNAFRSNRVEHDLAREIAAHLALLEDDYKRRGASDVEARAAARRAFGGIDQAKERHRDERSIRWLDDLQQDLRYALRMMRRAPAFAAIAVLTLALGIGANTAIFSVVHALLFKPLPYADSQRLVRLTADVPASESPGGRATRSGSVTHSELLEVRWRVKGLSHVAFNGGLVFKTMTGRGEATRLQGFRVSPGLFETLGVPAAIGRVFSGLDQYETSGDAAIVLSYATWQRYFAGDRALVGQTVALFDSLSPNSQINIEGYTILGVMPEGFAFPDAQAQFWIPAPRTAKSGGSLLARLANGTSIQAASAEIGGVLHSLRPNQPTAAYRLASMRDTIAEPIKPALLVLSAAVALVLLIACVNVANLLIARASARRNEIAVRVALGAGRARMIRQLLTESILLALVGGLGGVAVAIAGTRLLRTLAATFARIDLGVQLPFPRLDEIGVDGAVLTFTAAVSLVVGVVSGLAPAIGHVSSDAANVSRESASATSGFGFGRGHRTRGLLIVIETALAMVLLVGGGLLIHSFVKLTSVELGYTPSKVLTFQVSLGDLEPGSQLRTFADDLTMRIRSVPGVQSAAYARQLPLIVIKESAWFRHTPTLPSPPPRQPPGAPDARLVSQDYFAVLGARIVAGRGFEDGDRDGAPRAMVINETLARRDFPGESPLGKFVYAGRDASPWQIVGVVADIRQFGLDQDPQPQFFADFRQWPDTDPVFFTFLGPYYAVRTTGDPQAILPQVRDITRLLRSDAGVYNVATMEQLVSNSIARPRLYAALLGTFAAVAVALAAIGLYSVMAFAVAQRTREIGIRMALGATRSAVLKLVLGQALALTAAGVTVGLAAGAVATRYLEGMLFGVEPGDLPTIGAVSILFVAVALAAAYVPARRATVVDPVLALRND
jgi:putative ABC transport system permease protein